MGTFSRNEDFQNWLREALSVLYVKEGLVDFVEKEITDFQKQLLQSVILQETLPRGTTCSSCTTANLLVCPSQDFCSEGGRCNAHDFYLPYKKPNKPCPKGLCNALRDGILNSHRFQGPSWRNTDAKLWCTDTFEIAKCFMPSDGYSSVMSMSQVDLNGILAVIFNNKMFQQTFSVDLDKQPNIITKVRNIVCQTRQTKNYILSEWELITNIELLTDLLSDPEYLVNDRKAQIAIDKLRKLKTNTLAIHIDDIMAVLKDNTRAALAELEEEALKSVEYQYSFESLQNIARDLSELKNEAIADTDMQIENQKQELEAIKQCLQAIVEKKADDLASISDVSVQPNDIPMADGGVIDALKPSQMVQWLIDVRDRFALKTKTYITKLRNRQDTVGSGICATQEENMRMRRAPSGINCYWNLYLRASRNEEVSKALLLKQIKSLPNQQQLNRLQKKYLETKSKTTLDLLHNIENWTTKSIITNNTNVHYAWLAYTYDRSDNVDVQLVVEMEESEDIVSLCGIVYNHKIIKINGVSDETIKVIGKCDEYDDISSTDLNGIRKSIHKNAEILMKSHKHLSIIGASPVRSQGFNSNYKTHKLIPESCIVLYVRKKGLIPLGEEPFQTEYGYPVDVREGVFFTNMQASIENEEPLKMGCTIAKKITGEERYNHGTLGGFIDHPQYGLCGLTCAHVLLDDIEMTILQEKGELSWLDFTPDSASVYLYKGNDNYIKIGSLVKAILTKGDTGAHGMDAAIFQIERNFPSAGVFVNATTQADDPVRFDTGKAYGPSRFSARMSVFKYGSTTGKTNGRFINHRPLVTVRTQAGVFPANLILYNQLEIIGTDNTPFSDKGDSGSLVMIERPNEELFCVGIVEGGTSYGSTIATPVGPILEQLNVSSLTCFQADHIRDSVRRLERNLEQTKHEILLAINDIKQTNQRPYICLIL